MEPRTLDEFEAMSRMAVEAVQAMPEKVIPIPSMNPRKVVPELVHVSSIEFWQAEAYWKKIIERDLLKFRLPDVVDPTIKDVMEMSKIPSNICYYLVDPLSKIIVAEAMLNGVQGLCAYLHFSFNPDFHGVEAVRIANIALSHIFEIRHKVSDRQLRTLIGMTPLSNRLAIKFLHKLKFKKLDILHDVYYNKINRKYTDSYVSKLTSEVFYGR